MKEFKPPEGWSTQTKSFGVKLKPGKPPGATQWQDVQGRPVVKAGSTWKLQRQRPAPPKKVSPGPEEQEGGRDAQARQPKTNSGIKLKPEEQEQYNKFSDIAKEKLAEGSRKSFYPDPEQAARDEGNRRRKFAPYAALSEDQLSAISAYTSQWDRNMNSLLRTGEMQLSPHQRAKNHAPPSEAQVKKAIGDLTFALESLPDAPEGEFHRAISGSRMKENGWEREPSELLQQLHGLQDGDVIEDPGFSSFTAGGTPVLDQFMKGDRDSEQNIVFEVVSNKMKNISPISRYEREKEHMLPPGSKFKVIGRSYGMSRTAGRYTVIKLQQL
jgi:hypothetical protein